MEFFSEKELTAQVGHSKEDWPLVVLKELVDNALDACEEARVAPVIDVTVDEGGIQVSDNGPGIPESTVKDMLNFTVRVSSREAYVAPDRGAQGNALKTILAIPYVLDGNQGEVEITASGLKHEITVSADHILQVPKIDCQTAQLVKNGTTIKIIWPDSARSILTDSKSRFLQIAEDYAILNPHLTLNIDFFGQRCQFETTSNWSKWLPSQPTCSHWYEFEHLSCLIAAYIAYDRHHQRDQTVREFVSQFQGLKSTAKQRLVLDETGLSRLNLSSLVNSKGLKKAKVSALLKAMQKHSKPVKPEKLGIIGRSHIMYRFAKLGCEMDTFNYRKIADYSNAGLPYVLEAAFACRKEILGNRRLITGVNWSPGIRNQFCKLTFYGDGLCEILENRMAGNNEPVVFFLHMASPRVEYTDRGKTAIIIGGL
jgi:DNA topoisomerase VI subunit B